MNNGRPVIYVAGPLTGGDPFANVRKAVETADALRSRGWAPIVPHLWVLGEMIKPCGYEAHLEADLSVLRKCDALFRIPGISPGADREEEYAALLQTPIIRRLADARLP